MNDATLQKENQSLDVSAEELLVEGRVDVTEECLHYCCTTLVTCV